MSEISDLHRKAMELASQAILAGKAGQRTDAEILFHEAFEQERRAALLVAPNEALEPTRSVLLRSAASLALDCDDPREAERLIALALSGNPPEEIADELRDLYETVNFHRHLKLQGKRLTRAELQMSLAGNSVAYGMIPVDLYLNRVQTAERLILRTAERKRGIELRDDRPLSRSTTHDFELFTSVATAASFAVTLRIGRLERQLRLFDPENETDLVLGEFVDCLRLFQNGARDELATRVGNKSYFTNFVHQARRLAPDGNRIRMVGFTFSRGQSVETLALTGPSVSVWKQGIPAAETGVELRGMLHAAEKQKTRNTIGLEDENGAMHTIHVPRGILNDIVRPLWDKPVIVQAKQRGGVIKLIDIQPVEEA